MANLLQVITLGTRSVSVLLPATGALVVYYLKSVPESETRSVIPLILSMLLFAVSLILGLWNAFSYAVQFEGGEKVIWDYRYTKYPIVFAQQYVLILLGIFWMLSVFVRGVPIAPLQTKLDTSGKERSVLVGPEKGKELAMEELDRFQDEIDDGLLPDENEADLRMAAEIIVRERMAFWRRKTPRTDDILIALCSLCIPMPICPPKTSSYTEATQRLRLETLPGLAANRGLQESFRSAITTKLKREERKTIRFRRLTDYIQLQAQRSK